MTYGTLGPWIPNNFFGLVWTWIEKRGFEWAREKTRTVEAIKLPVAMSKHSGSSRIEPQLD